MAFDLKNVSIDHIVGAVMTIVGFAAATRVVRSPIVAGILGVAVLLLVAWLGEGGLIKAALVGVAMGFIVAALNTFSGGVLISIPSSLVEKAADVVDNVTGALGA
jgi:hypothetical protein